MRWILAYDISQPKIRRRVAKRLEQLGFRRQYSVFEGEFPVVDLQRLLTDLAAEIDPQTDRVTAWPAPRTAIGDVTQIGQPLAKTQVPFRIL